MKEDLTLVIAEKPSVAADLTTAIGGKFSDETTYYVSDKYIVSYAIGHIVELCHPGEIDQKYKEWNLACLPIIPKEYKLKIKERAKKQYNVLARLIKKKEVVHIINACDAGREGELIFRYIFDTINLKQNTKKKLSRLWLQSMTSKSIKEAFNKLRKDEEMFSLANAAKSRSEADWLIGINASRALTGYKKRFGGFHVTPCGRVQTPTLSMVVDREKKISDFKEKDYWTITAEFCTGDNMFQGTWFNPEFKKDPSDTDKKADRIWDESIAQQIIDKCKSKAATVTETSKPSSQKCPLLYDLTSLQREANQRFGFSAKGTLGILQSLYDKHKLLTYPRTGSRCLPEDYVDRVMEVFEHLSVNKDFGIFAKEALDENYIKANKRIFNDKKITDHHAIIATLAKPKKLAEQEQKIYNMVLQRFLAVFFPESKFLKTTRVSKVEGEFFKTDGSVLLEKGWKSVYKNESLNEKSLKPLADINSVKVQSITKTHNKTKPPARYNESTLLSAMESAGKLIEHEDLREVIKEKGIGTPATRANIIEELIGSKYIVREDRTLIPLAKASEMIELLDVMEIHELSSPELTGEWEYKLSQMEEGEISRKEFMEEIENQTKTIVEKVKSFDENSTKKETSFSPLNGVRWFETISSYVSEDGGRIKKIWGGRKLSPDELKTLLLEKKIGPLEGFRSKKGDPFTASLKLNKKNEIEFDFGDSKDAADQIKCNKAVFVGIWHVDGSKVYQTSAEYISESAIDNKETGVKIPRVLLGKEISLENMRKMLKGEKSELIKGFRSTKKNKRLFDAYLSLDKNGKIRFSFPPRKK